MTFGKDVDTLAGCTRLVYHGDFCGCYWSDHWEPITEGTNDYYCSNWKEAANIRLNRCQCSLWSIHDQLDHLVSATLNWCRNCLARYSCPYRCYTTPLCVGETRPTVYPPLKLASVFRDLADSRPASSQPLTPTKARTKRGDLILQKKMRRGSYWRMRMTLFCGSMRRLDFTILPDE